MLISRRSKSIFTRMTALIIAVVFTCSDSAFAVSLLPVSVSVKPTSTLQLLVDQVFNSNSEVERVRNYSNSKSPLVIHVQDAHSNASAQKSIHEILKSISEFAKNEDMLVSIGLEGAQGAIHPEYFDFFKNDPKANQLIVDDLLNKGELTGAELFAWDTYKNKAFDSETIFFQGVEDAEIYRKNLEAYHEVQNQQHDSKNLINKIYQSLFSEISTQLNSSLLAFIRMRQKYKLGKYDISNMQKKEGQLSTYLTHLEVLIRDDLSIDLNSPIEQLRFPQLMRFYKTQATLKALDLELLRADLLRLVKRWSVKVSTKEEEAWLKAWIKTFQSKGWLEKTDNVNDSELNANPRHLFEGMFRFIASKDDGVTLSEQVKTAMKIVVFESEMDAILLFEEIETVETALFEKLAKSELEREAVERFQNLELFEKLLALELTHAELQTYEKASMQKLFEDDLNTEDKKLLLDLQRVALQFYEYANQRDAALLNNAINRHRRHFQMGSEVSKKNLDSIVVLISGGFHTEGIVSQLDDSQTSHVVVRPRIESLDSVRKYHDAMNHENADLTYYMGVKNPFRTHQEALLYRSFIENVVPYFSEKENLNHDEIFRILKESIDSHPLLSKQIILNQTILNQKPALHFEVKSVDADVSNQTLAKILATADQLFYQQVEAGLDRGDLKQRAVFTYPLGVDTVASDDDQPSSERDELRQPAEVEQVGSIGRDLYDVFIQGHELGWVFVAGVTILGVIALHGLPLMSRTAWFKEEKLEGIKNKYTDRPKLLSAPLMGVSMDTFKREINYIDQVATEYASARGEVVAYKRKGKTTPRYLQRQVAVYASAERALLKIVRSMKEQLDEKPRSSRLAQAFRVLNESLTHSPLRLLIQDDIEETYSIALKKLGRKHSETKDIAKLLRSELRSSVAEQDGRAYDNWPVEDLLHSLNNKISPIVMIREIVSDPEYSEFFEGTFFYEELGAVLERLRNIRLNTQSQSREEKLRETVNYFQQVYDAFSNPTFEAELQSFVENERIGSYVEMLLSSRQQVIDFTGTWLEVIPSVPMELSVSSFVESVTRSVLEYRDSNMILNFDFATDADKKILTYAVDFQDVLENLLVNAFHATDPEKTGRQREITVSTTYIEPTTFNDALIEISIKDNGTGMSESVAVKIFDEGFTTKAELGSSDRGPNLKIFDDGESKEVEGTGIGMPSVKNKLENRLGGKIRFETEEGEGSVFTISLPIKVEGDSSEERQRAELRSSSEGISPEESVNRRQKYVSNLEDQRNSLDGLLSIMSVNRYYLDILLVATELIGVLSRDPEESWKTREILRDPINHNIAQKIQMLIDTRLDGDAEAAPEGLEELLKEKGLESLFVVINALKETNAFSPLRSVKDVELPVLLHLDAHNIERYFVEKGSLPAPLEGEVAVTDLWFAHDPNSMMALVATHQQEGISPHAKGGIRFMNPFDRESEYSLGQLFNRIYGDLTKKNPTQTGAIIDLFDLVRSQDPKNVLGTEFQGAKGMFVNYPGMNQKNAFKKFGSLFIDGGILAHDVPGPDIGMSGELVQAGIDAAKRTLDQHIEREQEYLKLLISSEEYSAKELKAFSIDPAQFDSMREAFKKEFLDLRNPLLVYERALGIIEENTENLYFLDDRIAKFVRMHIVADYFKSDILLREKYFESTDALADYFYAEIMNEANVSKSYDESYDPSKSDSLRESIDKILGAVITGGLGSRGAIDHVVSAITAKGVVVGFERTKDYLIKIEKITEDHKLRVAIVGTGDVGGSAATMITRNGDLVTILKDLNGLVFRNEGFTLEQLQKFNTIPPGERDVVDFFSSLNDPQIEIISGRDKGDEALFGADPKYGTEVIVTAAVANTINESNIKWVILPNGTIIAIVEGGNNTYKVVADILATSGIVVVSGATTNGGGVRASSDENQIKHRQTVDEITRPSVQNIDPEGEKVVALLEGHVEEITITRTGPKGGKIKGRITLNDGAVTTAHSKLPTLPVNTIVDLHRNASGELWAYDRNYPVGRVDEETLVQKIAFEVGDETQRIVVENGYVTEALAAIPQIKKGKKVEIVFPIRERKRKTYERVNETIYGFQTLVLALMELGNKERDAIHVQRAVSLMLNQKKAEIYKGAEYLEKRREGVLALQKKGYIATPEEMLHIVSADLARQELVDIQRDEEGKVISIESINPFTRKKIRVTADFEITEVDGEIHTSDESKRSELRTNDEVERLLSALTPDGQRTLQDYYVNLELSKRLSKALKFDQEIPTVHGNKKVHAEFLLFKELFDKVDFFVHYGKFGDPWQTEKIEAKVGKWTDYENRVRYTLEYELPVSDAGEYGVTFFARPKGTTNEALSVWQSKDSEAAGRLIIDSEDGAIESLKFISKTEGVSFASSGLAKIAFDVDSKSLSRIKFRARVQKYDDDQFSYDIDIPQEQISQSRNGDYLLSVAVDPREFGDYRVDFFATTLEGEEIRSSDLNNPAIISIYKSVAEHAELENALNTYESFMAYANEQIGKSSVSDFNQYLFDGTKNNERQRNFVSQYLKNIEAEFKDNAIDVSRTKEILPVYQALISLGIGKDVTFVTPEGPHAIGGGLGAVIRGLPNSLAAAGVAITVITNLYEENLKNKHRSAQEIIEEGLEINGAVVTPRLIGFVDIPYGPIFFAGTKNIETPAYSISAEVYLAEHEGVRYIFLRHPEMANRLYPQVASSEELKRAIFLARGAMEVTRKKFEFGDGETFDLQPSMMFSHDWVAGLIPFLRVTDPVYQKDLTLQRMRTGHFIHNFNSAYQGRVFANENGYKDIWGLLGVDDEHFFGLADPNDRDFLNVTASALYHSNAGLWSPSHPFSQEIVTAEGGQGLHYLLRTRISDLVGISNGIELKNARKTFWRSAMLALRVEKFEKENDFTSVDPKERVRKLKAYRDLISPGNPGGVPLEPWNQNVLEDEEFIKSLPEWKKSALKITQIEYGLEEDEEAILFSFVGRVAEQKGLQLLTEIGNSGKAILEEIMLKYPKAQFVFGGPPAEGDVEAAEFISLVQYLEGQYPKRVRGRFEMIPASDALGLMFASHYFLMPSKYEPGGITQLEAMAAGTVVVGRKTGGIAATIFDYDADQEKGNGFLFNEFTGTAFQKAIENAVDALSADEQVKDILVRRAAEAKNDWSDRNMQYFAFFQESMEALEYAYPHFRGVARTLRQIQAQTRAELRTFDTQPLRDDDDEMGFTVDEGAESDESFDLKFSSILTTDIVKAFEDLMLQADEAFIRKFEEDAQAVVTTFEKQASDPNDGFEFVEFLKRPDVKITHPDSIPFFEFYETFHAAVRQLFDYPLEEFYEKYSDDYSFGRVRSWDMLSGFLSHMTGVSLEETSTLTLRDFYHKAIGWQADQKSNLRTRRGSVEARVSAQLRNTFAEVLAGEFGLRKIVGLLYLDAEATPATFLEKYYFSTDRAELRSDESEKIIDLADAGSVGTNTREYYWDHTHPRISHATDSGYFTSLQYDFSSKSFNVWSGSKALPGDKKLRDKIAALERNERFISFMESRKDSVTRGDLNRLKLYLVESASGTASMEHPHLLTVVGNEFNLAFSGTNSGKEQAVYLTRDAFVDLDTRLLIDLLTNQIDLAINRLSSWEKNKRMEFVTFGDKTHAFMKRIRANKIIKSELEAVKKKSLKTREDYFDLNISNLLLQQAQKISEGMPNFTMANTFYQRVKAFHEAVLAYDFNQAVNYWGLITYEFNELESRREEYQEIDDFLSLRAVKIFRGTAAGISQVLNEFILRDGVSNTLGQEYGMVVGTVRVVDDIDAVGEEFKAVEEARSKGQLKGDIIWVLPYLPVAYGEIPGEAIIISVAGNRHAIDTAKEEAIPLAVIPDAISLLKGYDGEIATLRVDEDRDVRFRRKKLDEKSIKRVKEEQLIRVPPTRTDGPLSYRLSEIDENFSAFVGSKAATLGQLITAGLPVPDGFALSFRFWKEFYEYNNQGGRTLTEDLDELWEDLKIEKNDRGESKITVPDSERDKILSYLKDRIRRADFSPTQLELLAEIQSELLGQEISVEQLLKEHQSFLYHVKSVMGAKYNLLSVQARFRHKISEESVMPGVFIQKPIDSEFAGTMYTADDVSLDRNIISMMASHGQGAAVVGERGQTAGATVNKMTGRFRIAHQKSNIDQKYQVVRNDFSYVRSSFNFEDMLELRTAGFYDSYPDRSDSTDPNAPVQILAVTPEERDTIIFDDEIVARLMDMGTTIEALFDYRPQDIEWVIGRDGQFNIVQTRYQKTEKLPTEHMIEAEYSSRIAQIDIDRLLEIKSAALRFDLETLVSFLHFDVPMAELFGNKALHSEKIVATRMLWLMVQRDDFDDKVSAESRSEFIKILSEEILSDSMIFADAGVGPLLVEILAYLARTEKSVESKNLLQRVFHDLILDTSYSTHLAMFAKVKGALVFEEYENAIKTLDRTYGTAQTDIGVADRYLKLLSQFPLEHSRASLEKLENSDKFPNWIKESARRVISMKEMNEKESEDRRELRQVSLVSTLDFTLQTATDFSSTEVHFVGEGISEFLPGITALAGNLDGMYSIGSLEAYLPQEVSFSIDDKTVKLPAFEAAKFWILYQLVDGERKRQAQVDNPLLDGLRSILEDIKRQQAIESIDQGGTVHLQLEALPNSYEAFVPVLAVLADLNSSLRLNIEGLDPSEVLKEQNKILELGKEQGIVLKDNQFELISAEETLFSSVPQSRLKVGEKHGLIAENDDIRAFKPRKPGLHLFELESGALDQPELLSASLITVITAVALDRDLNEYLEIMSPRAINPELFGSIAESVATFFAAAARLAASA